MLLLKVLLTSWRQQWRQLLLVVFGLLCASAGLASVLALNETAKQKMSQLSTPFVGRPQSIATLEADGSFSKKDYAKLLAQGRNMVGLYRFEIAALSLDGNTQQLPVVALDVASLLTQLNLAKNADDTHSNTQNTRSAFSSGENLDFSLWQAPLMSPARLKWFTSNVDEKSWPIDSPVAVSQIKDDNVYLSMATAGSFQPAININELWIFDAVDSALAQQLSLAGFDIQTLTSDTGTLTDSFYINITAMGLLMFAVSMFISLNAYNLLYRGRKNLVRQLYLMGVDTRQLKWLFAIECNLLTLLCCSSGFALGLALAQLISPGMEMTLRNLYDASFSDARVSFFMVWLTVVLAGLLAANLILWFPLARSLNRLNLIDTPTSGTPVWSGLSQLFRRYNLHFFTGLLMTNALWLFVFPDNGLQLSFLMITTCVLCGCAIVLLMIPRVLSAVREHSPNKHPLLHYYSADAVRLSDKSRIAICAFFIAITANIGMNLMVGSFRLATDTWIDQQFSADFYLSTNQAEAFQRWATGQSDVSVYHRAKAEIVFENRKTEVLPKPESLTGHLPLLFKSKLDESQLYELNLAHRNSVNTIFINEQMSIRHQLRVAQQIQLNQQDYFVAGIYYDYGNMFNQILMEDALLQNLLVDKRSRQLFSLTLTTRDLQSKEQRTETITKLQNQLEELEVSYFSGEQIKDISMKVFEQTFVITSGLNLITLLVAGASLASSILIIEGQNNQQSRILSQLGISNLKIWLGSLMQYGYLISVVFILAIPFGILLSYQLINNINYAAFQWSYPLQHDALSYWFVYGVALLTVLMAVSLPFALKILLIKTQKDVRYG